MDTLKENALSCSMHYDTAFASKICESFTITANQQKEHQRVTKENAADLKDMREIEAIKKAADDAVSMRNFSMAFRKTKLLHEKQIDAKVKSVEFYKLKCEKAIQELHTNSIKSGKERVALKSRAEKAEASARETSDNIRTHEKTIARHDKYIRKLLDERTAAEIKCAKEMIRADVAVIELDTAKEEIANQKRRLDETVAELDAANYEAARQKRRADIAVADRKAAHVEITRQMGRADAAIVKKAAAEAKLEKLSAFLSNNLKPTCDEAEATLEKYCELLQQRNVEIDELFAWASREVSFFVKAEEEFARLEGRADTVSVDFLAKSKAASLKSREYKAVADWDDFKNVAHLLCTWSERGLEYMVSAAKETAAAEKKLATEKDRADVAVADLDVAKTYAVRQKSRADTAVSELEEAKLEIARQEGRADRMIDRLVDSKLEATNQMRQTAAAVTALGVAEMDLTRHKKRADKAVASMDAAEKEISKQKRRADINASARKEAASARSFAQSVLRTNDTLESGYSDYKSRYLKMRSKFRLHRVSSTMTKKVLLRRLNNTMKVLLMRADRTRHVPRGTPPGSPRGTPPGSPRGTPPGSPRGTPPGSPRGTPMTQMVPASDRQSDSDSQSSEEVLPPSPRIGITCIRSRLSPPDPSKSRKRLLQSVRGHMAESIRARRIKFGETPCGCCKSRRVWHLIPVGIAASINPTQS